MQKTIAILLNNSVYNDTRVIKIINTISVLSRVHLFYINGNIEEDKKLFDENVTLYPVWRDKTLMVKILRHSFFCFEFNFMKKLILDQKINYDYIWANDLPTLYPAFQIAKKINSKLIYDSHEIYTETINQFFPRDCKGIKRIVIKLIIGFMRKHGKRIERKIIPRTNTFITVNLSLLEYFKSQTHVPNGIVVMNLPHLKDFDNDPDKVDFRKQFEWKQTDTILIYQGFLNEGRGLTLLINSIKLTKAHFKLIIIGNGTLKESLEKQVKESELNEQIKFFDFVPFYKLQNYTKGADIGINFLEDFNLSKKLASPNKLFEYIHAGIPVLCSDTVENKRILDQFNIGILVNNTAEAISLKLNDFSEMNVQEKNKFKLELTKAKKVFCWENQIETINRIIK